jgi:hypothetical protein
MKTITPRDDVAIRCPVGDERRLETVTPQDDAEFVRLRQKVRVAAIAALGVLVAVSALISVV